MRVDIRAYGDGNPGGANAWKAGGAGWGLFAIIADGLKGLAAVLLAERLGHVTGWGLAGVAVAALLGHAYSPWLRWRGGKALAITFGVWTGLLPWQAPVVLGAGLILWRRVLRVDGGAVLAGMALLLIYLLVFAPSPALLAVWLANTLLLAGKYRRHLAN